MSVYRKSSCHENMLQKVERFVGEAKNLENKKREEKSVAKVEILLDADVFLFHVLKPNFSFSFILERISVLNRAFREYVRKNLKYFDQAKLEVNLSGKNFFPKEKYDFFVLVPSVIINNIGNEKVLEECINYFKRGSLKRMKLHISCGPLDEMFFMILTLSPLSVRDLYVSFDCADEGKSIWFEGSKPITFPICKHLESIRFSMNFDYKPEFFERILFAILPQMKKLKNFGLKGTFNMDSQFSENGDSLLSLLSKKKSLNTLLLFDVRLLGGTEHVFANLKTLNLQKCSVPKKSIFQKIAKQFPNLNTLKLHHIGIESMDGIKEMNQKFVHLETLSLRWNKVKEIPKELEKTFPSLKLLDLNNNRISNYCVGIESDVEIKILKCGFETLKKIKIYQRPSPQHELVIHSYNTKMCYSYSMKNGTFLASNTHFTMVTMLPQKNGENKVLIQYFKIFAITKRENGDLIHGFIERDHKKDIVLGLNDCKPVERKHKGVFKYHDDDCWCSIGGGCCNRNGECWTCCGECIKDVPCRLIPPSKLESNSYHFKLCDILVNNTSLSYIFSDKKGQFVLQ